MNGVGRNGINWLLSVAALIAASTVTVPAFADEYSYEPETNPWVDTAATPAYQASSTQVYQTPGTVPSTLLLPTTTGTVPGLLPATTTANIVELNVAETWSNDTDNSVEHSRPDFSLPDVASRASKARALKGQRFSR